MVVLLLVFVVLFVVPTVLMVGPLLLELLERRIGGAR
jgi:hypothetical protein